MTQEMALTQSARQKQNLQDRKRPAMPQAVPSKPQGRAGQGRALQGSLREVRAAPELIPADAGSQKLHADPAQLPH